eukprot:TRINITY_DN77018_c0_g1_i1.p1 TRINITY_DN77018_c0_g1~~TRINITY_DN77018_c0_g1_i1.p1  ORF type:complete len:332 (+),score=35.91 TRINITY_DN77018_c0_g1_i1:62-1057(+)
MESPQWLTPSKSVRLRTKTRAPDVVCMVHPKPLAAPSTPRKAKKPRSTEECNSPPKALSKQRIKHTQDSLQPRRTKRCNVIFPSKAEQMATVGYCLVEVRSALTDVQWESLTHEAEQASNKRGGQIFNDRHNDRRRAQHPLAASKSAVRSAVEEIARSALEQCGYTEKESRLFRARDPAVLVSLAGCRRQSFHTDYAPSSIEPLSPYHTPKGMLLAVTEGTKLDVVAPVPGSRSDSLWLLRELEQQRDGTQLLGSTELSRRTLHVPVGTALLFDALLVHAGSAYDERHHRVHMYLDHVSVARVPNRVFVLGDHLSSLCDALESLPSIVQMH